MLLPALLLHASLLFVHMPQSLLTQAAKTAALPQALAAATCCCCCYRLLHLRPPALLLRDLPLLLLALLLLLEGRSSCATQRAGFCRCSDASFRRPQVCPIHP
jgi:hypothetical protein